MSTEPRAVTPAAQLLLDSALGFQACRDDDSPVNDVYFEDQAEHQVRALIAAGWRPPVTSDATPDTPVDPRALVEEIGVYLVEGWELPYDARRLLSAAHEALTGSLRSQASGTPDGTP